MLKKAKKLYQDARNNAGFKKYFKNTSWLLGGQIFRMILGLLVSVAVARYLGPENFGLFNYVISIITLIGAVSQLGLQELAKREMVESPQKRNEIIGTCFVLNLFAGVISYSLMLWIVFMKSDNRVVIGLFALLGSQLLISSLNYVEVWFQSQIRSDLSVFASSITLATFAVLKIIAIMEGVGLIAFGYIFLLESLTLCSLQVYFYNKHFGSIFQWRLRCNKVRSFLKQSWPLTVSSLAVAIYMKIDQVMLGDKAVGQYSVAVQISMVCYFIPTILAKSLFPAILNARCKNKELYYRRLQHYFDLNVGIAYTIAILLSSTAPWLVILLFGKTYEASWPILAIHSWSCLFVFLGVARGQYLTAEKLFKFSMTCTVTSAIVNIILNYLLIPNFAGSGAAVATLLSQAISAFFSSFFVKDLEFVAKQQFKSLLLPLRMFKINI